MRSYELEDAVKGLLELRVIKSYRLSTKHMCRMGSFSGLLHERNPVANTGG